MKVILIKNIQGIGRAGDVKEVNDGYARNFLLPKGLAELATKHTINVAVGQKRKRERTKIIQAKAKEKLAKKIDGQTYEIFAKADDTGTLYSKLDEKKIAAELISLGVNIGPEEIKMNENIKKIGEYKLDLSLNGISCKIKLMVKAG